MFITLKTLLHTLLLPPAGPLLLAAAGALLAGRASGAALRRTGWVLLITGLAASWLLATTLVAEALTRAAQRCPALDLTHPLQAQAIVIFGGGRECTAPPAAGHETRV